MLILIFNQIREGNETLKGSENIIYCDNLLFFFWMFYDIKFLNDLTYSDKHTIVFDIEISILFLNWSKEYYRPELLD